MKESLEKQQPQQESQRSSTLTRLQDEIDKLLAPLTPISDTPRELEVETDFNRIGKLL